MGEHAPDYLIRTDAPWNFALDLSVAPTFKCACLQETFAIFGQMGTCFSPIYAACSSAQRYTRYSGDSGVAEMCALVDTLQARGAQMTSGASNTLDMDTCGWAGWLERDVPDDCNASTHWISEATCRRVLPLGAVTALHPQLWSAEELATAMMFGGAVETFGLSNRAPWILYESHVTGQNFMRMDATELRALGFTVGQARTSTERRDNWMIDMAKLAPSEHLMYTVNEHSMVRARRPGVGPTNVSFSFTVNHLMSVDETSFNFGLELDVHLAWHDVRIQAKCVNAYADGTKESDIDPCANVWRPRWRFVNAIGEQRVTEDAGLTTYIGGDSTEANAASKFSYLVGQGYSDGLERTVGSSRSVIRSEFSGEFNYRRFPYDTLTTWRSWRSPPRTPSRSRCASTGTAASTGLRGEHVTC